MRHPIAYANQFIKVRSIFKTLIKEDKNPSQWSMVMHTIKSDNYGCNDKTRKKWRRKFSVNNCAKMDQLLGGVSLRYS